MALNDRQIRFCKEYVIDFNATRSAIEAGYSEESARATSSRLLTNDNIQKYIQKLQSDKSKELNITFEDVVSKLYDIGNKEQARDGDKIKALEQVAKLLGFYEKDNNQKKTDTVTIFEIPDNGR